MSPHENPFSDNKHCVSFLSPLWIECPAGRPLSLDATTPPLYVPFPGNCRTFPPMALGMSLVLTNFPFFPLIPCTFLFTCRETLLFSRRFPYHLFPNSYALCILFFFFPSSPFWGQDGSRKNDREIAFSVFSLL